MMPPYSFLTEPLFKDKTVMIPISAASDHTVLSPKKVVSGDKVMKTYAKSCHTFCPKSVDAIFPHNNQDLFVEFKSSEAKEQELYLKGLHSAIVHCELTHQTLADARKQFVFIYVTSAKQAIKGHWQERGAGTKGIQTTHLKKYCYANILHLDPDTFIEQYCLKP